MHYSLRSANSSDVSELLSLIHQKAKFDGCPDSVTATKKKLSDTLFGLQPMAYVLFAEADNEDSPVGFASYHFTYSTFLAQPNIWLDDLFVKSEHRNHSIGARLIDRLCKIAREQGCGRVDWTVDVSNQPGIRFYERMGSKLQTNVHLCRLGSAAIVQRANAGCDVSQVIAS